MKGNGTVSHCGTSAMPTRLATANTPQATSSQPEASTRCRRSRDGDAIPLTSHGRDRGGPQLGPEPADVAADPVGARFEVIAPDRRQQPLLGHDLAWTLHELAEQQELPLGQGDRAGAAVRLPADQVEPKAAGDQAGCGSAGRAPPADPPPEQPL